MFSSEKIQWVQSWQCLILFGDAKGLNEENSYGVKEPLTSASSLKYCKVRVRTLFHLVSCTWITSLISRNGVVGIGILVIVVTLILIFYPRESTRDVRDTSKQPVDNLSVVRTTVFVAACVFAVVSLVLMLIFHWMEPQYAPALLGRKKYTF